MDSVHKNSGLSPVIFMTPITKTVIFNFFLKNIVFNIVTPTLSSKQIAAFQFQSAGRVSVVTILFIPISYTLLIRSISSLD